MPHLSTITIQNLNKFLSAGKINMESLAGRMRFCLEGEDIAFVSDKPYVRVCYDVSVAALAKFMVSGWQLRMPDIIVTVTSGIRSSRSWRKDELRFAFQRGFTKLFNTANAWIFTHGYNQGIAKLIGEAVKLEEDRRSHTVMRRGNSVQRFYNKKLPKIFLFGIASKNVLRDPAPFDAATPASGDVLHYEFGEHQIRQRYDLNPHHTHFIIVNESDYSKTVKLRFELEKQLHLYANQRSALSADNISDSSSDEDDNTVVFNDFPPSMVAVSNNLDAAGAPETASADDAALTRPSQMVISKPQQRPVGGKTGAIPIICIFVQGGPMQLDQLLFYLRNSIPCVLIRGSGLMADIVAAVHDEVFAEASTTLDDAELLGMRADIIGRLRRHFGRELPSRKALDHCYSRIAEAMRLACPRGKHLLSVCNLTTASDFVDLDKHILKALFSSQDANSFQNPEQVRSDLLLTVKWNHPRLAQAHIFATESWSRAKIDKDIFDQALLLQRRESFVDMFLEQGFKLHKYVSHRRLLYLYRHAEDTEFFHSVILEGLLNYPTGSPVYESFIIHELNPLMFALSQLRDFFNVYVMTCNAFGLNQSEDAAGAERRALLALLVWAIMLNRYKLAVIFWKHCDHPIPTALFASHMYTQLAKLNHETELKDMLYSNGKAFSEMAVEILELGYYNDNGGSLAFQELETHYAEFNHKTPIIMAYEARNLWFLAHPCCQKWLSQLYQGKISVVKAHHMGPLSRIVPESVKIVLSAWFILPMFLWIRFPKVYTLQNINSNNIQTERGAPSVLHVKMEPSVEDGNDNAMPTTGIVAASSNTDAVIKRVQSDLKRQARLQKKSQQQLLLSARPSAALPTAGRLSITQPSNKALYSTTSSLLVPHENNIITKLPATKSATPLFVRVSSMFPPLTTNNNNKAFAAANLLPPLHGIKRASISNGAVASGTLIAESITVPAIMSSQLELRRPPTPPSLVTARLVANSPTIHADDDLVTPSAVETTAIVQIPQNQYRQSRTRAFSVGQNSIYARNSALLAPRQTSEQHDMREQELQFIAEEQRQAQRRGCTSLMRHQSRRRRRRDRRQISTSFAFDGGGGGTVMSYSETTFEEELPLARKIYYLWQAPITKFWSCLFAYVAFLLFYSFVAFVPECDGVHINFVLDVIMWLWTALVIVEIALRTLHQQQIGVPFHFRRRVLEIGVLTLSLLFYTALRILYYCHVGSISPMISRLIMLNGLLYFYFRVLSLFFPISRELGPLVVRVRVMVFGALVAFLKLVAPFFFAYMIVMQVVFYPDRSLDWATLLQAFRRSIYSFFTTQLSELDETPACARTRTDKKPFCMVGAYTDVTCPNQTFWSYLYILQWMFIFKLVLMSLLYAFFTNYTMRISQESEVIWKYQRYQLVLDIATRSALPPPLSIIPHAMWLCRSLAGRCWRCGMQLGATRIFGGKQQQQQHRMEGVCPRIPPPHSATSSSIAQQHARDVLYRTNRSNRSDDGCITVDMCDNLVCAGNGVGFVGGAKTTRQHLATLRALNPSNYWQVMARQYWRDIQAKEYESSKPQQQFATVIAIKDELEQARVANKRMRNRMVGLEKLVQSSLKHSNKSTTEAAATTSSTNPPATREP